MRFVLEIELGNEKMLEGADVADALRKVATRFGVNFDAQQLCSFSIQDNNGNTIGSYGVKRTNRTNKKLI